jgi:hypothetical protein
MQQLEYSSRDWGNAWWQNQKNCRQISYAEQKQERPDASKRLEVSGIPTEPKLSVGDTFKSGEFL